MLVLLLTGFALSSSVVVAEIYKRVDADGRVSFSDQPPAKSERRGVEKVTITENITVKGVDVSVPGFLETTRQAREEAAKKKQSVVMYSAAWCGVCKKARQYFRANRITFREYDIETSERGRKAFARLKGRGVPIIIVGKKRMDGFNLARFKQMYPH